ncbi:cbb3-type cytochrome oxidase assembly protein CcoS [Leadbetterella byssophila]|jgi:cbb3-type cytochrome oxidase maturation protein|uniref:Cytochrome oxidase maturation protein, cbb3-type n=1 Tax=Leadbetterella byssophila (strain DSM 17132 / JCM 16389 / KACC 11308 / NBRC 106382 / 4M15) TaxID=649349 RepID=E4RQX0_LEAB4|nr:cbb3-type cytochrome oxidase assembly protein CcoS [Leadbetterella byssophila]ADQ18413.1 cytochrome oxidase maturation protein, cbb3-type [Leadbetterella byssophila DSM 17132]
MGVIVFLVILALLIAGGFLISFFWATKDGQFDDTHTPAIRILFEDEKKD